MGQNLNANDPVSEDDVEGHGLLRNAAIATAIAVGGGGVAMASPAAAQDACVSTTEKLCVDTADDPDAGEPKAEGDDVTEAAAGFVIGLLVRGSRR